MHLHLEERNTRRSDCNVVSLSWMGKVPENIPDGEGWKLNRATYYQEGWLATGSSEGQIGVTFTACHCKKSYEPPPRANFNLRGHRGEVCLVRWNEPYQKLATCDTNGVIYVWIKHEGRWSIELINDRNSQVSDFAWSHDGRMALIVYRDGFVLVGSVAGQRFWSSMVNVQDIVVTCGTWSPDDQEIILGTTSGQIIKISSTGVVQSKATMDSNQQISAMMWSCEKFNLSEENENTGNDDVSRINGDINDDATAGQNNNGSSSAPPSADKSNETLAVSCKSGDVYLMDSYQSDNPHIIKTGLTGVKMDWSNDSKYLAIGGFRRWHNLEVMNELHIYTRSGLLMWRMQLDKQGVGKPLSALTWGHNDRRLFVAAGCYVYSVWVSKKVSPLQFLCHRSIERSLSIEFDVKKLPLPSKLRTSISALFCPTIKGFIPQPTRLCEFVCLPPPPTERLYCTIMKQGDDDGGNYTLYLEYLGGLIPLLKAKKTSKLKPEFVVFDPRMQTGKKPLPRTSTITDDEATVLLGSSDSEDGGNHSDGDDKQQKGNNIELPKDTESVFSRLSPRFVRRKNKSLKKAPMAREKRGPATSDLLYCKELSNAKKLLAVTSNIWGTRFRIQGLASYMPEDLGSVLYKTSLFHLQPRQMTVSIFQLSKQRHRRRNSIKVIKQPSTPERRRPSMKILSNTSKNFLNTFDTSSSKPCLSDIPSSPNMTSSSHLHTTLAPVFPSHVSLTSQLSHNSVAMSHDPLHSPRLSHDLVKYTRGLEPRASDPTCITRRSPGRHKSNSLSPADNGANPVVVECLPSVENLDRKLLKEATTMPCLDSNLHLPPQRCLLAKSCNISENTYENESATEDSAMNSDDAARERLILSSQQASNKCQKTSDNRCKEIRALLDSDSFPKQCDSYCACDEHAQSCLPISCEGPPLSPTQIYTCQSERGSAQWVDSPSDGVKDMDEDQECVDSTDCQLVRNLSMSSFQNALQKRSQSVPSNKNGGLIRDLSLSRLESRSSLTDILSHSDTSITSNKRVVLSRLPVSTGAEEYPGKDTPVHNYAVLVRGSSGIEVVREEKVNNGMGSNASLDSVGSTGSSLSIQSHVTTGCFNSPAHSPFFSRRFPFIKRSNGNGNNTSLTYQMNKKRERASSTTRIEEHLAKRRELSVVTATQSISVPNSPGYKRTPVKNESKLLDDADRRSTHYPLTRKQRKSRRDASIESSDDEMLPGGTDDFSAAHRQKVMSTGNHYHDLATFQKEQLNKKMLRGKVKRKSRAGQENSSPRRSGTSTPVHQPLRKERPYVEANGEAIVMNNKAPIWNEASQVYQLDFGGRVTQESAKNFQIEHCGQQVMQFGRIDSHAYTLDFQYPFTCAQAFAVALANVTQRLK